MPDRSLSPPTVTEDEKPLRREVAMAYRATREAGRSHHEAVDAARAVYSQARPEARRLPEVARACLTALGAQLRMLKAQILGFDRRIMAWHRSNETSERLDEIPGVGPALATALIASVADPKAFRSARNFSAWVGGLARQDSARPRGSWRRIHRRKRRWRGRAAAEEQPPNRSWPAVTSHGKENEVAASRGGSIG